MNGDFCSLILIAGFVALSAALPSTDLKFKPQQQKDDSVDQILKILAKSEPLARDHHVQFIRKWGIDPNDRLTSFKWTDCGDSSSKIVFHNIRVTPDPIVLPGTLKVSFDIEVKEDIPDSLSGCHQPLEINWTIQGVNEYQGVDKHWEGSIEYLAEVKLDKIIGPIDIPIPCINDVGSCHYKDVCSLLTQIQKCPDVLTKHDISCQCPVKQGSYIFPMTGFKIPEDPVPGGDYTLKVDFSYKQKSIGCLSLAASFTT